MINRPATATRQRPELQVQAVGRPAAVSSLARLLLRLQAQPTLRLITADEQPRDPLPSVEQGPQ